jgi:hypothetical protein
MLSWRAGQRSAGEAGEEEGRHVVLAVELLAGEAGRAAA